MTSDVNVRLPAATAAESFEAPKLFAPRRLLGFVSIPLIILIWEITARYNLYNTRLFPAPSRIVQALFQWILSGDLILDLLASGQRAILGYLAGAIFGMIAGAATGRFELGRQLLAPVFQVLRPIPPISFVPIAILWFGLEETSKVFLVFWGVFFIVWLTTHVALANVDRTYINAARALGAKAPTLLFQIILPAALPAVSSGLRAAIPIAFYSLVAGEIAGATHGVAYMIELAHTNFQVPKMFAGLAVIGMASAGADWLFVLILSRLFPWAKPRGSNEPA